MYINKYTPGGEWQGERFVPSWYNNITNGGYWRYLRGELTGDYYSGGGPIHIKPENRGKFTAAANRAGKSVQAYASQILSHKGNYSPTLVKRANFARNAAKWHAAGGRLDGPDDPPGSFTLKVKSPLEQFYAEQAERAKQGVMAADQTARQVPVVQTQTGLKTTAQAAESKKLQKAVADVEAKRHGYNSAAEYNTAIQDAKKYSERYGEIKQDRSGQTLYPARIPYYTDLTIEQWANNAMKAATVLGFMFNPWGTAGAVFGGGAGKYGFDKLLQRRSGDPTMTWGKAMENTFNTSPENRWMWNFLNPAMLVGGKYGYRGGMYVKNNYPAWETAHILNSNVRNATRNGYIEVGPEYFSNPESVYRVTSPWEVSTLKETGVTTRAVESPNYDLAESSRPVHAQRRLSRKNPENWIFDESTGEFVGFKHRRALDKPNGHDHGVYGLNKGRPFYDPEYMPSGQVILETSGIGKKFRVGHHKNYGPLVDFSENMSMSNRRYAGKSNVPLALYPHLDPIIPAESFQYFTKLANGNFRYNGRILPNREIDVRDLTWADWQDWLHPSVNNETGIEILKSYIPEYNRIARTARKTGSYLKMEDGSDWLGDERSWLQLKSENGKRYIYSGVTGVPPWNAKSFPSYSGNVFSSNSPKVYNHFSSFGGRNYPISIPKSTRMFEIDAKGADYSELPFEGKQVHIEMLPTLLDKNGYGAARVNNLIEGPLRGTNELTNTVVVFKNTPRKSLIGGTGEFDLSNPNIFRKYGGRLNKKV